MTQVPPADDDGAQPAPPHGQQPAGPPPSRPGNYGAYGQQPPTAYGEYGHTAPGYPQPPPEQYATPGYGPPVGYGPGGDAPGGYGPGPYGSVGPQAYGQYGAPSAMMAAPLAVQPGIIPLRPLTLGEIYDGAFRAVRSNPGVMFGLAAVVVGVTLVLQTLATFGLMRRLESMMLGGVPSLDAGALIGGFIGLLLSAALASLATLVYTGLAIVSVSESVLGRKISLGELWRRARTQALRLVLLTFVQGAGGFVALLAIYAVALVLVVGIAGAGSDGNQSGLVIVVIVVPLLMIGAAVLAAFVIVKLMLAPSVIMLEHTGVFASMARSWRLVKGHFWRLLGIMLLTMIIVTVAMSVVSVPISMVGGLIAGENITALLIISSSANLLSSLIGIPLVAGVMALLYIDVRMRKEGLDIELAQAAQAR